MRLNRRKTPNLFKKRENCCGCSACYAICPVQAISMQADKEGFFYPIVDEEKCICCYKCMTVCSFKEEQKKKGFL